MEGGGKPDAYYDANYEANYREKPLIEINKKRLNRKITNLEREASKNLIQLDKLKSASWSGIPSCKCSSTLSISSHS